MAAFRFVMPPPIKVEFVAHDLGWAGSAIVEGAKLRRLAGTNLIDVHHIGSTAIPGIFAKPILDLMPVVASLVGFDESRERLEHAGHAWWGEFGLAGRRYRIRDHAGTGRRLIQLHVFEHDSAEINRHLAFRDYLLANRTMAEAYEREKTRCLALHSNNSHAYADCKSEWIKAAEAAAIKSQRP